MRTTDDQLKEILHRADSLQELRPARKKVAVDAAASATCLALLVGVLIFLPRFVSTGSVNTMSRYGSLLIDAPYLGLVVVCLLAFALGVCVTLLCVHIGELRRKGQGPR